MTPSAPTSNAANGDRRLVSLHALRVLLIETLPESDPKACTPALDRLGLPERGVPRIVFEDGLHSHAVDPREEIGLHAFESTVPRAPFDAYPRLASPHGQRREQLWTDFDRYQVTREPSLHALVGANVQCDGADDFCAEQRDYDAPQITARVCLLRRERILARYRPQSDSRGASQ